MKNRYYNLLNSDQWKISLMVTILMAVAALNNSANDIYKEGLSELENNNPEKAVQLWSELDDSHPPDYRVGFYLIKTVTAHNMRDRYEQASKMYYRGLESRSVGEEEKTLLLEDLEFAAPLMERSKELRLREMVENSDAEVYNELADFWESMRITVTSDYNERLLEHWERCHYVTENFKTSRRNLYDDRGEIFLRFGEPNKKRQGTLQYNAGFAEYILSTRMSDGGGGGSIGNAVDAGSLLNTIYMVRSYHEYPTYETWVYSDLAEHRENVIYLFGNSSGSNFMSLMDSVDDFVPSAAFNTSGRNRPASIVLMNENNDGTGNSDASNDEEDSNVAFENERGVMGGSETVPPGLVLQLMYYRQMATIDEYFGSRYDDMMDRYMNKSMRLGNTISRQFHHINSARFIRRQGRAPQQRSEEINKLISVDSDLYTYRFFDEEMEPYLRVYLDVDPVEAIAYDELRRHNNIDNISYDKYEIINRLRMVNGSGDPVNAIYDTLQVYDETNAPADPLQANALQIDHTPDFTGLKSKFELHNRDEYNDQVISEQSTFRKHLKGIGSAEADVKTVMETGGLVSSDIILGYSVIDEKGESSLTIAHDKQIPQNRNLNFYYEAYNLPKNDEGLYSFTLTYEIERDRSFLGRVIRFGRSSGPSVTIENTDDSPHFSQILEIVSEELNEGDYKLKLTFMNSDDEVLSTREEEFTIY